MIKEFYLKIPTLNFKVKTIERPNKENIVVRCTLKRSPKEVKKFTIADVMAELKRNFADKGVTVEDIELAIARGITVGALTLDRGEAVTWIRGMIAGVDAVKIDGLETENADLKAQNEKLLAELTKKGTAK